MHFIFGGRCMGKLDYAKGLADTPTVCDAANCGMDALFSADILYGVHLLVKRLIAGGVEPEQFFKNNMGRLAGKILIGDEIGSGIVPVDAGEREWRDETGRVYQLLTRHADRVTRIWAGIPEELKRDRAL